MPESHDMQKPLDARPATTSAAMVNEPWNLFDLSWTSRKGAERALVLALFGDPSVIPADVDEDRLLRLTQQALTILPEIVSAGDKRDVVAVLAYNALEDQDSLVRLAALQSLSRVNAEMGSSLSLALTFSSHQEIRIAALESLLAVDRDLGRARATNMYPEDTKWMRRGIEFLIANNARLDTVSGEKIFELSSESLNDHLKVRSLMIKAACRSKDPIEATSSLDWLVQNSPEIAFYVAFGCLSLAYPDSVAHRAAEIIRQQDSRLIDALIEFPRFSRRGIQTT